MNFRYRPLAQEDLDSVWALFQGIKQENIDMSFAKITKKEALNTFVDNPSELTYVAVHEDAPHEVLCLVKGKRDLTEEKKHAAFLSAATHPSVRGSGLVAKTTAFALEEMKKQGVTIARIYVYSNNTPSMNAIKKLQFTYGGTVLRHHKDPHTGEYWMISFTINSWTKSPLLQATPYAAQWLLYLRTSTFLNPSQGLISRFS